MLLVLSEEQKAHLGCLPRVGGAGKLNAGVDTVQHGVEGLMYLLTESSKLMISEMDFQDSIHVLGFSDELNKLLLQLYLDNRKEIRSILGELAPKLPSYHSLEWRLDVQTPVCVEVQVYLWDYCLPVQGIQPTQRLGVTQLPLFASPNTCLLLIVLEMFSRSSSVACYENLVPSFVVRSAHKKNSCQVILYNRRPQF
eukprot:XP_004943644.1 COMM domain-containing protein 2 isoform X3 [Gallus gallus]